MFKISSLTSSLNAFTVFAVATIVCYPSITLSQTPQNERNAPQGCLSGNPDGTYNGSGLVTRDEFAVGLNACLNQVNELIPPNRQNLATKEDFEVLIKRQRELNQQLRELNERVENPPPKNSTSVNHRE